MNFNVNVGRFKVPETGRFVQILRDWLTDRFLDSNGKGRPRCDVIGYNPQANPTGSYPDTYTLPGAKPDDFVPLDEPWQRTWFDALARLSGYAFDDLKDRWAWLTRHGIAFTDLHARQQGFTDFILGENLNGTKGPIQVKSLVTGGNILSVLEEGDDYYVVEALNPAEPPPPLDELLEKRWLLHTATQTTRDFISVPFPQLGAFEGGFWDVPYFLVSLNGRNKISSKYTRPIPNGAWYTPFFR